MAGRVERRGVPPGAGTDLDAFCAALADAELVHLHWPELLAGPDVRLHRQLVSAVLDARIPIVWTQHNVLPHRYHRAWRSIYQRWADAAEGVIHHSEWGRDRVLGARSYRADAIHRVIRHGHWGTMRDLERPFDRDELAQPFGLTPDRVHLGVLGAPRRGKDIDSVIDGFLAAERNDMDLTIFSLDEGQSVPNHPRIRGRRYRHVDRPMYNRRLAFLDVLILPFRDDGSMLTTGLVADAIATGKPAIVSDWPYLVETLGSAAICYGATADELASCLAAFDASTLDDRSVAIAALQAEYSWERAAEATVALYEELLDRRSAVRGYPLVAPAVSPET